MRSKRIIIAASIALSGCAQNPWPVKMDVVTRPDLPRGVLRSETFADREACRAALTRITERARRLYPDKEDEISVPGIMSADADNLQLVGNFEDMLTRYRGFECKENVLSMWESFATRHRRLPPPPPPPPPPPLPPPNPPQQ